MARPDPSALLLPISALDRSAVLAMLAFSAASGFLVPPTMCTAFATPPAAACSATHAQAPTNNLSEKGRPLDHSIWENLGRG
jgi:hypothetical protein